MKNIFKIIKGSIAKTKKLKAIKLKALLYKFINKITFEITIN